MRLENNNQSGTQELKDLLEQNLKYTKAIYESTEKTRRYIRRDQIFGMIRVLIILLPIVAAVIYAQPYLKFLRESLGQFQSNNPTFFEQIKNLK